MISAADETRHQHTSAKYWNESFYFNFFDEKTGTGFAARIGYSPNVDMIDGFLIFFFADGGGGFVRMWKPFEAGENIEVGGLKFTCQAPMQKWKLSFKGDLFYFKDPSEMANFSKTMLVDAPKKRVNFNLTFETFTEVYDFHSSLKLRLLRPRRFFQKLRPSYFFNHLPVAFLKMKLIRTMSKANHYEQAGHYRGNLTVGQKKISLRGTGQRDHSWGVRDMRVPAGWQWFSCQFGEELAFNCTRVEILGFEAIGGFAYYKGSNHALKDFRIVEREANRFKLLITLASGEKLELPAKIEQDIPVTLTTEGLTCMVNEGRAQYEWQGQTANGIAEFMRQLYP